MNRGPAAHELFYPVAALHAALALPLSVLGMVMPNAPLAGLRTPAGHAHEMLLGFALAVVAGNQLGVARPRAVIALLLLWLAARIAFVVAPDSALAAAVNAAFAVSLAWRIVPRLAGAAKKWRNRVLPLVLAALCLMAGVLQLMRGGNGMSGTPMLALVSLFALLMLFMGGRIVAPAIAGQFHHQGENLEARVQPRLEAALLACGMLVPLLLAVPHARPLAGGATAAAGALALVRLLRWRPWGLRGRLDLWCLAAGYAWLGLGLLALGTSLMSGPPSLAALHLITVGALGTLTFNVMASTWTLRARRGLADVPLIVLGTALLAAATVLRALASFDAAGGWAWIEAAAACWSAAFVLLLMVFWRCFGARQRHLERVARREPHDQRDGDSSSTAFWTAR